MIRYSYLWHHESMAGHDEGRKDRPCAVILAAQDGRVAVAPITHTPPSSDTRALEIPSAIGRQLGLDDGRSWIVTNEVNVFRWPGEDIRPATRDSWAFGQLPPSFTKTVAQDALAQKQQLKQINRDIANQRAHDRARENMRARNNEQARGKKPDKDNSR